MGKHKKHLRDQDVMVMDPPESPPPKDDNHRIKSSGVLQLKHAFAGGLSGAMTRAISQPLDVLKIRFQLQVEPISSSKHSKYNSMGHAVKMIIREEGIKSFWKGHNPAQMLSIVFGIAQFWTYEECMNLSKAYPLFERHTSISNFIAGGVSGAVASFAVSPLDIVRTRLIAQDTNSGYRNSWQGCKYILKRDGIPGLYRGMVPALIQVMPLTGANFMIYKFFGEVAQKTFGYSSYNEIPGLGLYMMGAFTGVTSKTLLYPFDLSKKRLQIQGFSEHRKTFGSHFKCKGVFKCLAKTIELEGISGMYKGLAPALLKAGLTTACHFAFYDQICRMIVREGEV